MLAAEVSVGTLLVTDSAEQFFSRALAEALTDEKVAVSVPVRAYLVRVLCREVHDGCHPDGTLGDRYALALRLPPLQRAETMRTVGDRAMVYAGLWWERAASRRGWPEIRYGISIGSRAYRAVGGEPYDELAEKFAGLVGALTRFGTERSLASARDVLRLYQLWHETRSRHAAEALATRGVFVGSTGVAGRPS